MKAPTFPLFAMTIATEADLVTSWRATRLIAASLGLDALHDTRLATAVSEILRNAAHHPGQAHVEFCVRWGEASELEVTVSESRPGSDPRTGENGPEERSLFDAGMLAAQHLVGRLEIESEPGGVTVTILAEKLPRRPTTAQLSGIVRLMPGHLPADPYEEIHLQNEELLGALEMLGEWQEEISLLSVELQDTNRGVIALYAQMEEQAARLREAIEAKNRFLYFITHEIRTPVNAIISLARLLLDHMDGDLNEEQEKQVKMIFDSSNSLNGLANDILDLAKAKEGKIELNTRCFSVDALFSALRGVMMPLARDSEVVLRFEEPPRGLEILSDETKVNQILRNFVSNALKFTERGFVRVSVSRSPSGDETLLSVEDTGIGIAPEHEQTIFEEFSQLDHPLQEKVKGTGLGLPLSRHLAKLIGGRIEVASQLGRGSIFTLILPSGVPQTPQATEPAGDGSHEGVAKTESRDR